MEKKGGELAGIAWQQEVSVYGGGWKPSKPEMEDTVLTDYWASSWKSVTYKIRFKEMH